MSVRGADAGGNARGQGGGAPRRGSGAAALMASPTRTCACGSFGERNVAARAPRCTNVTVTVCGGAVRCHSPAASRTRSTATRSYRNARGNGGRWRRQRSTHRHHAATHLAHPRLLEPAHELKASATVVGCQNRACGRLYRWLAMGSACSSRARRGSVLALNRRNWRGDAPCAHARPGTTFGKGIPRLSSDSRHGG